MAWATGSAVVSSTAWYTAFGRQLAQRTGTHGFPGSARLAVGLWAAFPAVLLTGPVVPEKVSPKLAAIHSGDWLIKLLLVTGVVARRRA